MVVLEKPWWWDKWTVLGDKGNLEIKKSAPEEVKEEFLKLKGWSGDLVVR